MTITEFTPRSFIEACAAERNRKPAHGFLSPNGRYFTSDILEDTCKKVAYGHFEWQRIWDERWWHLLHVEAVFPKRRMCFRKSEA